MDRAQGLRENAELERPPVTGRRLWRPLRPHQASPAQPLLFAWPRSHTGKLVLGRKLLAQALYLVVGGKAGRHEKGRCVMASGSGRAWFERHQAQAAAARKRPHKQLEAKRPNKARRNDWKQEVKAHG